MFFNRISYLTIVLLAFASSASAQNNFPAIQLAPGEILIDDGSSNLNRAQLAQAANAVPAFNNLVFGKIRIQKEGQNISISGSKKSRGAEGDSADLEPIEKAVRAATGAEVYYGSLSKSNPRSSNVGFKLSSQTRQSCASCQLYTLGKRVYLLIPKRAEQAELALPLIIAKQLFPGRNVQVIRARR